MKYLSLLAIDSAQIHDGGKLEKIGSFEEELAKTKMEIGDTMKAQERLKVMEVETRQLKSGLSDSQSKITQLERNLTLSGKKIDDLTTNVPSWREKEATLLEQLAATEFRVKQQKRNLTCKLSFYKQKYE